MTEAEQLRVYAEALASYRYDPFGFVMWAFPWSVEGTDLEKETGPDTWQFNELDAMGKHLQRVTEDGSYRPFRSMTASGHGAGKANRINDLAITPSGIRRWGDLQAGDLLFGSDGSPTEIKATHHFPNCPMMRVTFDDGSTCDVSTGHLWNVRGRQERRKGLTTWRTLETCEIARLGVKRPNGVAEARQWEIPIQGAPQFDARPVHLHPYLVGVWIGDGCRSTPSWGKPTPEIADKIRSLGYSVHTAKDGMCHRVQGVMPRFRALPIFDLGSHERFIPDDYKFNTVEVRRALFDGLVDSDGEANKSGSIGYSTTSERLAHDVIWLARSLGCKAMMQPTVKHPQYNGPNGEKLDGRPCWRVTINAPFNPFTHPVKRAAYKPSEARYLTRWIDSIEPIEPQDGMCVTVAAPDGLYQANHFIVTHNSAVTSMNVMWALMTCVDARGVVTANSETQLRTKTWAELAKWWTLHVDQFPIAAKVFTFTRTAFYALERPNTWRVDAIPNNPQNPAAFAGMHNAGKRVLMLVDEASEIADPIWDTIEGAMTDEGTELILLGYGNPTKNTGRFREMVAGRQRHRFRTVQLDSRNVKRTNKAEIAEWVEAWGEDSDFVRVRVRGVFPRVGTSQLIGTELVQAAMKRDPGYVSSDPLVAGLDVARMGDDESVLQPRRGRDARTFKAKHWRNRDTVDLAGDVAQWCAEYQPEALFIDMGNTGAGVYDHLVRMVDKNITRLIPVDFGAAGGTTNMNGVVARVANKRADMWVKMREWLSVGAIENDPNLETDLTGVQYGFKGADGSEILLESKKAMKARGVASPDWGDALALTFAYPVAARVVHTAGERLQAALKTNGASSFASLMDNAYQDLG